MIGVLAASTFFQFQQFQSNVKDLSFNLPSEITNNMPNVTQDYSKILGQMQPQSQGQEQNTGATSTKEYQAPNNSFSFEYPGDWQTSNNQIGTSDTNGKILFAAYKMANSSSMPIAINYLTVEESYATSTESIIEQYKKDAQTKGITSKITQSEIIRGEQTIPAVEIKYNISEPTTGITANLTLENAIVVDNSKIYVISAILQSNDQKTLQEIDGIMGSIEINKNPG